MNQIQSNVIHGMQRAAVASYYRSDSFYNLLDSLLNV